jgi:SAM-dependent methyltransferase
VSHFVLKRYCANRLSDGSRESTKLIPHEGFHASRSAQNGTRAFHVPRLVRRGVCAVHRTVGRLLPPTTFSRRLPGVPGRVHFDDQMLRSDAPEHIRHYLTDAGSALENIEASLNMAGRAIDDVRRCLDLPSGYGRLTRHLVARLGARRVTVSDVDPQAVRFCGAEFGVSGFVAPSNPERLRVPGSFDVIFVGSLLTHLPIAKGLTLMSRLVDGLEPGGQLIFSTQGTSCLSHLEWSFERLAR